MSTFLVTNMEAIMDEMRKCEVKMYEIDGGRYEQSSTVVCRFHQWGSTSAGEYENDFAVTIGICEDVCNGKILEAKPGDVRFLL